MAKIQHINVVKIGGNVIDNADALARFIDDFAKLEAPKILIHGGGKLATRLSEKLEIPTQMIEGRRVTDRQTLDVVTMVYAGLINKQVVAGLQAVGCNAIGLSGADANVVPAVRRSPVPIDFGFVGDIGNAIQRHAHKNGFSVVRDLCGHGVGLEFHEEPDVEHFGRKGTGMLLVPGMVFTIEPMINMGTYEVFVDEEDGWTVVTEDELPSAQWEHTFLMTEDGLEILTY